MTVGVNHDTLLTVGWLDLQRTAGLACAGLLRPLLQRAVHRSVDVDFAYVGTRTTGTQRAIT